MRISTHQIRDRALGLMLDQQAKLAKTQQQMATGKRFETAAQDPVGAVQAMSLTREIAATEQYQGNAEAVRARQSAEEDALAGATELLHSVRELMVQANSDTLSDADRQILSQSLDQKVDELLGFANTSDGSGDYLFAGFQSGTQPFSRDGQGQVTYQGDQGQRMLGIGPGVTAAMTDSGAEVFQRIRAGNGTFVTAANTANTGSGSHLGGADDRGLGGRQLQPRLCSGGRRPARHLRGARRCRHLGGGRYLRQRGLHPVQRRRGDGHRDPCEWGPIQRRAGRISRHVRRHPGRRPGAGGRRPTGLPPGRSSTPRSTAASRSWTGPWIMCCYSAPASAAG